MGDALVEQAPRGLALPGEVVERLAHRLAQFFGIRLDQPGRGAQPGIQRCAAAVEGHFQAHVLEPLQ